jgi:hypothetical protein
MSEIIASYLVKVIVRKPAGVKDDDVEEPASVTQLEQEIQTDLLARHGWDVTASAERTDI